MVSSWSLVRCSSVILSLWLSVLTMDTLDTLFERWQISCWFAMNRSGNDITPDIDIANFYLVWAPCSHRCLVFREQFAEYRWHESSSNYSSLLYVGFPFCEVHTMYSFQIASKILDLLKCSYLKIRLEIMYSIGQCIRNSQSNGVLHVTTCHVRTNEEVDLMTRNGPC